jgi:hypothetical protein
MIRMVTEYATRSAQSANQVKWRPGPEEFTTKSAEGTEAGEGWLVFPDPDPNPFFFRSDLCVLCALCGEKAGNDLAFKPFGALGAPRLAGPRGSYWIS